ncbi:MAG: hypothetical protein WBX25_07230 [Rhodomicrobium sp.]
MIQLAMPKTKELNAKRPQWSSGIDAAQSTALPLELDEDTQALLDRMSPQISELVVRMTVPHEHTWESTLAFRNEIIELNKIAKTDEEQLSLCFAFHALMDDAEKRGLIHPNQREIFKGLRKTDYVHMLSVQALIRGSIDPTLLEHVTRREVEACRLSAEDDFRKLAVAGAAVLGKSVTRPKGQTWLGRLFGRG